MKKANNNAMVESIVAKRMAIDLPASARSNARVLHNAGMQVQIMRHDGRTENADCHVEHGRVPHDLRAGHQSGDYRTVSGCEAKIS